MPHASGGQYPFYTRLGCYFLFPIGCVDGFRCPFGDDLIKAAESVGCIASLIYQHPSTSLTDACTEVKKNLGTLAVEVWDKQHVWLRLRRGPRKEIGLIGQIWKSAAYALCRSIRRWEGDSCTQSVKLETGITDVSSYCFLGSTTNPRGEGAPYILMFLYK
eukprot:1179812-Amphidinium_carterae.1